jgi:hypothetical protein
VEDACLAIRCVVVVENELSTNVKDMITRPKSGAPGARVDDGDVELIHERFV